MNQLEIISKAAHGSMRDALSILDQAIAYSGDEISSKENYIYAWNNR